MSKNMKCNKCDQIHKKCAGHKRRKHNTDALEKCDQPPMQNGKCRLHGGKTPKGFASPHFVDGKRSKYAYLPGNYTARLETVIGDFIENLESSIEIQKALETRHLEKLGTLESTEAWIKMQKAVSDYTEASFDPDPAKKAHGQAKAFGEIKFIVNEGLSESFLFRDIQSIQESQRKLSETLSKVRKEAQEIYTQEHWNEILHNLAGVLREKIKDRELLNLVQQGIYERSNLYGKNENSAEK